jgi:N-acetylneuraminic acid mutarotase
MCSSNVHSGHCCGRGRRMVWLKVKQMIISSCTGHIPRSSLCNYYYSTRRTLSQLTAFPLTRMIERSMRRWRRRPLIFDTMTQSWSFLPPMRDRRDYAGAAICNQQLYVVGGRDAGKLHGSVEMLDFATSKWSSVAEHMHTTRSHCTVLIDQLTMFVVGGYDQHSNLASIECLDLVLHTWSVLPPMTQPRHSCGAVMHDRKLIVLGGYSRPAEYLASGEVFDFSTRLWSPFAASLHNARAGFGMVVENDVLYILGGQSAKGTYTNSAEGYNLATKQWTQLPGLPASGWHGAAIHRGQVFVYGSRPSVYDVKAGSWTELPSSSSLLFEWYRGVCCVATLRLT